VAGAAGPGVLVTGSHNSHTASIQVSWPVSKDQVNDAPDIDRDAHISDSGQDALRQYYSGYLGTAEETGRGETG
jgi:hypothetical protein